MLNIQGWRLYPIHVPGRSWLGQETWNADRTYSHATCM